MKTTFKSSVMALAVAACFAAPAWAGSDNQQIESTTAQQASAMGIDDLLKNAESLVNKTVTIEGTCTHTCRHGAKKMFLAGNSKKNVIRVEAGKLGKFDTKIVKNKVEVVGTLKEQRIDEAYLQKWEAQLAEQTGKQSHGNGEAGCNSEKQARGETANTVEGRIADFRKRIAERKSKEGKAYLSFYYVLASKYAMK